MKLEFYNGAYVLNHDAQGNLWIDKKGMGVNKKGEEIEVVSRFTGYYSAYYIKELIKDFLSNCKRVDVSEITQAFDELQKLEKAIDDIAERITKEWKDIILK